MSWLNQPITIGSTGWGGLVNTNFDRLEKALQSGTEESIGPLLMTEDSWIGIGASSERLVFDGSANQIDIQNATLDMNGNQIASCGNVTMSGGATVDGVDVSAHASRHKGGADDIGNATTGTNGLLPQLSGSASHFLRGDGSWATPSGGSGDFSDGGDAAAADRTLGNTSAHALGFLTNDVTRLKINTSASNGSVDIGSDDTNTGILNLFGDSGTNGAQLNLHNAASEGSVVTKYTVEPDGDDGLEVKADANVVARVSVLGNVEAEGYHTRLGSRLVWKESETLRSAATGRGKCSYDGINWSSPTADANLVYQHAIKFAVSPYEFKGVQSSPYGLDYIFDDHQFYNGYRKKTQGDQGAAYAMTWPDHAHISVPANQYYTRLFRVWDMGTPDYNSGWTAVSSNNSYLFAHGIGANINTALVFVEFCETSNGSGYRKCMNTPNWSYANYNLACAPVRVDTTNVYVRTGNSYCFWTYSNAGVDTYLSSGYCRVRVWNISADYDSGSWAGTAVNVDSEYGHKLGTRDYYMHPVIAGASGGPTSSTWTIYGSDLSHSVGPVCLESTEEKVVLRSRTAHGYFRNNSGTPTAPTGTGYKRLFCYL